jgi:hypothetical protein
MIPNLSQLTLTVEAPKRYREDDRVLEYDSLRKLFRAFGALRIKSNVERTTFDDLPPDIVGMIILASRTNDCKMLRRICDMNDTFREACDSDEFWEIVLKTKEWWPTWNSGLPPRRWYEMLCDMADVHRARLLALNNDTNILKRQAFEGCTSLALTMLPSGLQHIEAHAFNGCTSLALTTLPSGLKHITVGAFQGCTSLALTTLPPTLQTIGQRAFAGCTSLALTTLPPTLNTIGQRAFEGCEQLKNTDVGRAILQLNPRAFDW